MRFLLAAEVCCSRAMAATCHLYHAMCILKLEIKNVHEQINVELKSNSEHLWRMKEKTNRASKVLLKLKA